MTLREELARRLYELGSEVDDGPNEGFRWNCPEHVRLALADECLRQMRWARHSYRWAAPETTPWDNGMDPTEDVTLAPPEWKP